MNVTSDPIPPVAGAPAPSVEEPISVKDWVITYLILSIPLVGLIMLFVWGFSEGTPPSKANWAKAMLIIGLIGAILGACFFGATFLLALAGGGSSSY